MLKFTQSTVLSIILLVASILNASDNMNKLTQKEKNIVLASAYAAKGDQNGLKYALSAGLNNGVSINEFKEILVQLYAYCGFPRSLNALETYMKLLKERGNKDIEGMPANPIPNEKILKCGANNQTKLVGHYVDGELFRFAPAIDEFLKSHLFGDIFARNNISWRMREIATIAMLAAMNGVQSQLDAHIKIGKNNGITDIQVTEILSIVQNNVTGKANTSIFLFGNENIAYSKYFSGKSYIALLTQNKSLGVPIFNVTFEPACRNNWHSHTGGQILVAAGGIGYYQERGKPARMLVPGDIVEISPNVEHWHGASPDSWFSHLAVECNSLTNKNTWLEPVLDAEYATATSGRKYTTILPSTILPSEKYFVRQSNIKVEARRLAEYNALLKEETETSMKIESGVLVLYAVFDKKDPTKISILEIYANEEAYKNHIQTPHFQKYKKETFNMIKELELINVEALSPKMKIK